MNVSSILRSKGSHVETARPSTPIGEAASRLNGKGIGSLVILDDVGNVIGVFTETNVVRALSEHGKSASGLPIQAVLDVRPATCKPEDSLEHVMSLMTTRKTRHLPVIEGEALVGIVSIGDVVKIQVETLKLEVGVLRDYARARP